jgi:hypothetical protein
MQHRVEIIWLRHGQRLRPASPPDSRSLHMKHAAVCCHHWLHLLSTPRQFCVCRSFEQALHMLVVMFNSNLHRTVNTSFDQRAPEQLWGETSYKKGRV